MVLYGHLTYEWIVQKRFLRVVYGKDAILRYIMEPQSLLLYNFATNKLKVKETTTR